MKNTVSFFILMIVVAVLFTGCKKYEEGPAFTLTSVKNRLTKSDWDLDNLTIGGEDSTLEYRELGFNYSFDATSDGGLGARTYTYNQTYTYEGQLVQVTYGSVTFDKRNDNVTLASNYSYSSSAAPLFSVDNNSYRSIVWKITKLTKKEFWLETTLSGMPVSMKLKSK